MSFTPISQTPGGTVYHSTSNSSGLSPGRSAGGVLSPPDRTSLSGDVTPGDLLFSPTLRSRRSSISMPLQGIEESLRNAPSTSRGGASSTIPEEGEGPCSSCLLQGATRSTMAMEQKEALGSTVLGYRPPASDVAASLEANHDGHVHVTLTPMSCAAASMEDSLPPGEPVEDRPPAEEPFQCFADFFASMWNLLRGRGCVA